MRQVCNVYGRAYPDIRQSLSRWVHQFTFKSHPRGGLQAPLRAANPIFVTSPLTSIQTRHPRTHDTPTPLQFISPSFFFQHRAVYISDPPDTLFLKISLLLHCGVAGLILSWALLRATDIPVVSEWWEFATVADASEFVPVRCHPSSSTSLTATVIRGIDFVKPLKVVFHMHNVFPAFRRVCEFPQFTILRLQPCPSRRSPCRHFHCTLDIKSPSPVGMEDGFLQLGAYQEHQEGDRCATGATLRSVARLLPK